jgi:putative phage-type endonuclease
MDQKIKGFLQKYYHGKFLNLSQVQVSFQKIKNEIKTDSAIKLKKNLNNYLHYSKKYKKYLYDTTKKDIKNDYTNIFDKKINSYGFDDDSDSDVNSQLSDDDNTSIKSDISENYEYPIFEESYTPKKNKFGPFGTQWVHDEQIDDEYDEILKKRERQFELLRAIELPEQRTPGWFKMREGKTTASDGGIVVEKNKYEKPYQFILKKTVGAPFNSNKFCYHGKKLEEPATMVYAYRMNVCVEEFGLMGHPTIPFLGASPDGICSQYKYNKKNKSKYVGRMLEIKCPLSREEWRKDNIPVIDLDNLKNRDVICPAYYWVQVQLQLECCDLEECDFWQCKIGEYSNREEFIADTDPNEPFRSKDFGQEKGCLIQLLPYSSIPNIRNGKYWDEVYDKAIFIYPSEIEMTPKDCDNWVKETLTKYWLDKPYDKNDKPPKYRDYYFDKVIYWKMEDTKNVTIDRDRKWFKESLPKFEKMWNYIEFLRANRDSLDTLIRFINTRNMKRNVEIMKVIEKLCDPSKKGYKKWYTNLLSDIEEIEVEDEINHEHIDTHKKDLDKAKQDGLDIDKFYNTLNKKQEVLEIFIKKLFEDKKEWTSHIDFINKINSNSSYLTELKSKYLGIDEDLDELMLIQKLENEFNNFNEDETSDDDDYGFD